MTAPDGSWSSTEAERLLLLEEHVGAAEQLEATTVGLSGGLDHPLDDFGAKGLATGRRDSGQDWHQAELVNPADHGLGVSKELVRVLAIQVRAPVDLAGVERGNREAKCRTAPLKLLVFRQKAN